MSITGTPMEAVLEKISSYNIFNFLLPGTVFAFVSDRLTNTEFVQHDLLIAVFVYYFLGLVISRVGSLVVEPVLKGSGFVTFSDYSDFVDVSEADPTLATLSEVNNTLRTMISLSLFVIATIVYDRLAAVSTNFAAYAPYFLLLLILALFLFAFRKQTAYITKRVNKGKSS